MTKRFCLPFLCLCLHAVPVLSQGVTFGPVTFNHLATNRYDLDTTAAAIVLNEFGEAFIENGDQYNLIYKYRVRLKILKKDGLSQGDFEIPLYKRDARKFERLVELKASTYNIEDSRIKETPLNLRDVYVENTVKHLELRKFAMPDVKTGSVIDVAYTISTPFIYNFRTWEFQSDLPKLRSEFWARIPGVYIYNASLRGFLKLDKNESQIVKDCLGTAAAPRAGGFSADCALMKYGMTNIPAFVEEEYMTAKKNFLSAIHFELSEVRYPDGRVDKVTKEWKDAEDELRKDNRFGVQLKRGKEIGQEVRTAIEDEKDALAKAKRVYNLIRQRFLWNENYSMFSEHGIRKAFDDKKGNVGDINLALVAALRFAGLDAHPVILSTRSNGTVLELYPVLSEFNYVVAHVEIDGKSYLLDATDRYLPFGYLPERCINGKGRVIVDRKSYWTDLVPVDSRKSISVLSLTLETDGVMRGNFQTTFSGYEAVAERKRALGYHSLDDYIRELKTSFSPTSTAVTKYEILNLRDEDKPVVRKLEIEVDAFDDMEGDHYLLNPFMIDKLKQNPFRSAERLYPVDFGIPIDRTVSLQLTLPEGFELANPPESIALALPNGGGRFLLDTKVIGNQVLLSYNLSIRKTVYSASEYHFLRELFSRIVQAQNTDLLIRKQQ